MSVNPVPSPYGQSVAPRVLILDDDTAVRRFLHEIVREAFPASHIAIASDGQAALDLIEDAPFDLAFIDLVLPASSVSGVLVCQALCRNGRTRVVVVSGLASPAVREACEALGIAGFIRKPISTARVRSHLSACQPARESEESVAFPVSTTGAR